MAAHAEGCRLERWHRQAVPERDPKLGRFVRERPPEGWTPERIAGRLKRGEGRGLHPVSLETIHAFVHRPGRKGETLRRLPPRGRTGRGRRRARQLRSAIAGRRSIHDRPGAVQEREDAGHWEGDPPIRRRTRPVPVLKERETRFVLAAQLAGKSAVETVAVLTAVVRRLDPRLRASITLDDGPRPAPAAAPSRGATPERPGETVSSASRPCLDRPHGPRPSLRACAVIPRAA